jgi:hypothetical protein
MKDGVGSRIKLIFDVHGIISRLYNWNLEDVESVARRRLRSTELFWQIF